MVPEKETALLQSVIAKSGESIIVVIEAETQFEFARALAVELVLAVRARAVDVHCEVAAHYVAARVNRFLDSASRATVIQQAIDVAVVAAAKELEALVALGLSNASARPNEQGLRAAPATQETQNPPKRPKRTPRKSNSSILVKPEVEQG